MSSAGIPPPPATDAPRPRRAGAVATFLFLLGVLVLAVGLLSLPAPPARPVAAPTSTPVPAPSPNPATEPGYTFIATRPLGEPVVWEKCVLTYRLLVDGAPSYAASDVEEALGRVAAATGVRFEHVSDAADPPSEAIATIEARFSTGSADIVFAWESHADFLETRRELGAADDDAVAWTIPFYLEEGIATHIHGALIVFDRDVTAPGGFDTAFSHGVTVLHELGHAVGLDHVTDPDQVMESGERRNPLANDYADGDLAGLAAVGAAPSCAAA